MLGDLNDIQIYNLLTSQAVGRMACSDGKQPYIVPVTFAYDGEYIYGQTNEGLKLDILRKNPNVCFETGRMTDMRNWQSVLVYGRFQELKHAVAEMARNTLFKHVYPLTTSSTINPYGHAVSSTVDDSTRIKPVMYRIKINKITGRFEKQ